MQTEYDSIVIGSGFGGAVAACRLAQAGLRVLLLERGRRYPPGSFPRGLSRHMLWRPARGLFDVRFDPSLTTVLAAGLGGGSLIYSSVLIRPPAEAITEANGWPRGYSRALLDPYLDLVGHMLNATPITSAQAPLPIKSQRMREVATQLGRGGHFFYPDLAISFKEAGARYTNPFGVSQAGCTGCGECNQGCNVGAKNTLDLNYLALATRHGAELQTESEVIRIAPAGSGYRVDYLEHREESAGRKVSVHAEAVFLCAGAIGSTELLLRCRQTWRTLPRLSNWLGRNYSANGDHLAFGFDLPAPFSSDGGPTITSSLVISEKNNSGSHWFLIQDGGFPESLRGMVEALRPSRGVVKQLMRGLQAVLPSPAGGTAVSKAEKPDASADIAVFLAMGRDLASGRVRLGRKGLRIDWPVAAHLPYYDAIERVIADLVEGLGGTLAQNPLWQLFRTPVTVHSLGGCCMADDPTRGVTDANGQVYGYANLFVLDGGILPAATCGNPAFTIAAVAARHIEHFIRRRLGNTAWRAPETADARPMADPLARLSLQSLATPPPRTPPMGLRFSETLRGELRCRPRVSDASRLLPTGVAAAHGESGALELSLTITIPDLSRLFADPGTRASVSGWLRASPFTGGDGAPIQEGSFRLFVQTDGSGTRHMLYDLPFAGQDGRSYRIEGRKDLHDEPGFDAWADATTLLVHIHNGAAPQAPSLASGIARISVPEFIRQLSTLEVLHEPNPSLRLLALGRFGKMFLGNLWDAYVASKFSG